MKCISSCALLGILFWLSYSSVEAFGPTTRRSSNQHKTRLAWQLPGPLQRTLASNNYWYQDIGTGIDRPVEYKKDSTWEEEELDLLDELCFPFLSLSEDAMDCLFGADEDDTRDAQSVVPRKKRRFPVRMVCGAWNRIRRNPQSTGVL